MTFRQFVGQDRIKNILQDAIRQEKIGHAYSFEGSAGMGKAVLAEIFAGAVLCHEGKDDVCGECLSCRKVFAGSHPDLEVIRTEKASIGVDEIRSIQEKIIIKPIESNKKVFIIAQADKMTAQAQNCLLKTLEEPPPYAVLILCVSNSNAILKTIQSRCIRIKFDSYSDEEVKSIIAMSGISGSSKELDFAAVFSQGIVGKAFSILSEDFLKLREEVLTALTEIEQCEIEELMGVSKFFDENKNLIDEIFDIMIAWYRDIAVYGMIKKENMLINRDRKDIILNNVENHGNIDLVKIIDVMQKTQKSIKMNVNYQLAIDNMILRLWEVYNGKSCRSTV